MAFSCLLNRQHHYVLRGVLQFHSRIGSTERAMSGAARGWMQSDAISPIITGYNCQINVKDQEISANLLGYNTWHVYDSLHSVKGKRNFTMQARSPHQVGQKVGLQLSLVSPGIILEPYKTPEPISVLKRLFTRAGWKRTKDGLISELKTAYAIAKLRKLAGYSKPKFYREAVQHYKEVNTFLAQKDRTSLRKLVTENMYSIFKKEIKQRESIWSRVHWEMIEPAVRVQTLQARMIGVDKDDLDKAFVQVTLEMLTNQKFAAYDLHGKCVAGDTDAKVLVQDVWVFERSLFQPDARWRVCGRISL